MINIPSGSHSEPTAQVVVAASNGWDTYFVTQFKDARHPWECECAMWRSMRKTCSHISAAKQAVRSGVKAPGVISIWPEKSLG